MMYIGTGGIRTSGRREEVLVLDTKTPSECKWDLPVPKIFERLLKFFLGLFLSRLASDVEDSRESAHRLWLPSTRMYVYTIVFGSRDSRALEIRKVPFDNCSCAQNVS